MRRKGGRAGTLSLSVIQASTATALQPPSHFDQALSKQDRPDEWCVAVTTVFLKALHQERLAQASLVRIYATVRHYAR